MFSRQQATTAQIEAHVLWTSISREEAARLKAQVAGEVLLPGDDGYDAECFSFNLNLALAPTIVVRVANASDVQAAVMFAARRRMPVAVKATGHNTVNAAHGALLISTRRMNQVTIDIENRTARIEPGVRWSEVIDQAAKYGLAPMNGSSPLVGAIGYTLGGGHSAAWSRSKGYAADHVVSLDVVTADGELRHATAQREPELFWALRGGQGNFGVVTAMVCDLFPQTRIYGGGVWFPIEHVPEVVPAWREWAETLPEEATTSIAVQRLPELSDLPERLQGASVLHLRFIHLGTAAEGEQLFAPMRSIASTVLDTVGEMPYTSIGLVHMDPQNPMPYSERTMSIRDLSDEAIDAFIALTGPQSDCPLISVEIRQLGGAMDRQPAVPNAVASRGVPYVLIAFGVSSSAEKDKFVRGYLDKLIRELKPWAANRPVVNFVPPEEAVTPDELRDVYGAERYDVLARVKKIYDPLNIFRMNHNIVPASPMN